MDLAFGQVDPVMPCSHTFSDQTLHHQELPVLLEWRERHAPLVSGALLLGLNEVEDRDSHLRAQLGIE